MYLVKLRKKKDLLVTQVNNPYNFTIYHKIIANCLTGDTSVIKPEDYHPDPDLSKSVRFRSKLSRLIPEAPDQKKVFGLPSIRKDLNSNFLPSIANLINFGSDPDAYELLYPNKNAILGLSDKDFKELLTKDEVIIFIYSLDI